MNLTDSRDYQIGELEHSLIVRAEDYKRRAETDDVYLMTAEACSIAIQNLRVAQHLIHQAEGC